jgi:hypothetical protein
MFVLQNSYISYNITSGPMNSKIFFLAVALVTAFAIATVAAPALAQNATDGNATTAGGNATTAATVGPATSEDGGGNGEESYDEGGN